MLSHFSKLSHSSCYSAQSFLVAIVSAISSLIQCSVIPCYSELSYFCYSAKAILWFCQPFSRSCQSFCYSAQPFCKITQSFSRFRRSFSEMTDVGAGAWGGSAARSGMHGSIGMAHGLVGWAHATEPHGTEACRGARDEPRRGARAITG
jgi:hypothetical protein